MNKVWRVVKNIISLLKLLSHLLAGLILKRWLESLVKPKVLTFRFIYVKALFISLLLLVTISNPALAQENKSFLWSLKSPQGRTSYIMGSIHLAHAGLYPLNNDIMNAFKQSQILIVELNSEDMDLATMDNFILDHAYANDRRDLPERLSKRCAKALKDSGLYQKKLAPFTPWLAALMIQLDELHRLGFRAEYGLDVFFIKEAKKRYMKIIELETLDEQMGMMVNMSTQEADLFLLSTLLEIHELPQTMQGFFSAWKKGDSKLFADVFFKDYNKYPEMQPVLDILIFRRNKEMAQKLNNILSVSDNIYFIIVGAGHLVGDASILSELAAMGWQLKQL